MAHIIAQKRGEEMVTKPYSIIIYLSVNDFQDVENYEMNRAHTTILHRAKTAQFTFQVGAVSRLPHGAW